MLVLWLPSEDSLGYLPARWGHSSVGRAPALQAGGRRFEPGWLHFNTKETSTRDHDFEWRFLRFEISFSYVQEYCTASPTRVCCGLSQVQALVLLIQRRQIAHRNSELVSLFGSVGRFARVHHLDPGIIIHESPSQFSGINTVQQKFSLRIDCDR